MNAKTNLTYLIITADDFGSSPDVNQAVIQAHDHGALSCASLMVTGNSCDQAARMAKARQGLCVGLHVALTGCRPILEPETIPDITGPDGCLLRDPLKAGLKFALHGPSRRQALLELEAQFRRFLELGLPMDHVSGHQNLHLHPAVFPRLIRLARRCGAAGIRIPRDDLLLALRHHTPAPALKLFWAMSLRPLGRWASSKAMRQGIRFPERVYGLYQSGSMNEPYLIELIEGLDSSNAEIYLHPSYRRCEGRWGPNPGDLSMLLSEDIHLLIQSRGIRLASYMDLFASKGGASWRPSPRRC